MRWRLSAQPKITVRATLGALLPAAAISAVGHMLPGHIELMLWAVFIFLAGAAIGAFDRLPPQPSAPRQLIKGVGALLCLYGALLLVGGALGGEDLLHPIPNSKNTVAESGNRVAFQPITTLAELDAALSAARAAGRPVMVDFTADWCVSCKELERYTFPDAQVVQALKPFALLRVDVTENSEHDKALLRRFGSFGPPTMVFFDRSGRELEAFKLIGFVPADRFAKHVRQVAEL